MVRSTRLVLNKRVTALLAGCLIAVPGSAQKPPQAPELFGTVALPVTAERYHDGWERARRDAIGEPRMRLLIEPARRLSRERQIAYVHTEVHRRIRWMSDATEWGQQDYWASAAETLQRGAGDIEDRAIVKMQALKNLGFAPRDLFLTMGRDAVGGPATVLIVRLDDRIYMLDDSGGAPITTDRRPDFQPMVTLGHGGSWVHGRRVNSGGPTAAAAAGLTASR